MWTIAVINGVAYGSLLFLLAAGFSMIFGVLKIINLAHGSFYLIGGYIALSIVQAGGGFLPAIAAGALFGALAGVLCERFLLYRLQGQYLPQVLVTMGVVLIASDIAHAIWGGTPQLMQVPAWLESAVPVGVLSYPFYRLMLIGVGLTIALGLWWSLERTRIGATVRAAVDDEETAQAVGISVPRLRMLVFGAGGLLAGLAGGLGMPFLGARPGLDLEVFLLALVVVVVGGIGSLWGAYLAAMLVGIIDSFGKILLPELSMFMLFLPMLLILVFRPSGISGRVLTMVTPAAVRSAPPSRATGIARTLGRGLDALARVPFPVLAAMLALLIIVWPLVTSTYLTGVATLVLIWSIFALGFNVLLGYAGMPSFGHAAFFGAGAYAVVLLAPRVGAEAWSALAVGTIFAGGIALVLGAIALRTRLVYFLLATVALGQLAWAIAFKWRSVTGGDDGQRYAGALGLPGITLEPKLALYYAVALAFMATLALLAWVHRSPFRLILNGLRENESRLAVLGYHVWLYRFGAFALSGAIAGLAGGLYAFHSRFVSPELLGVVTSSEVLLMTILGGAGSLWGPVVGAVTLLGLEELVTRLTHYWGAVQGLIFIGVAIAARGGIAGAARMLALRSRG